jgi:hypothetical protein
MKVRDSSGLMSCGKKPKEQLNEIIPMKTGLFKKLANSLLYKNSWYFMELNIYCSLTTACFCSVVVLINAAYAAELILYPLENFPFTYQNLLQVLFYFQIFEQNMSIYFRLFNTCHFSHSFFLLDLIIGKIFANEKCHRTLHIEICFSLQVLRVLLLQIYSSASLCISHSAFFLPIISCTKYLNLYISRPT